MIELARNDRGTVTVDPDALTGLVADAALRVEGVRAVRSRALRVAVSEGDVSCSVGIACAAGVVLPEVAARVQSRVAETLAATLAPEAIRVDVTVEEVAS